MNEDKLLTLKQAARKCLKEMALDANRVKPNKLGKARSVEGTKPSTNTASPEVSAPMNHGRCQPSGVVGYVEGLSHHHLQEHSYGEGGEL